jgi:hypothetical protein
VKTREFGAVKGSLIDKIWAAANKEGLTMPYPTRTVHMVDSGAAKTKRK